MSPRRARPLLPPFVCVGLSMALGLAASSLRAEMMELTDLFGRSIRAEPLALENETLKIRREDGAEFAIELKSLSEDDQTRLRAWAATRPKHAASPAAPEKKKDEAPKNVPDLSRVTLALSRFKAESNTIAKFEGYSHKHEMWGYSFQVTNRGLYPVEKVRLEYNLFARTFVDSGTPSVVPGKLEIDAIGSNRSESAKTKTAEVCKRKGYYTANNGGELRGVWVKLYVGDTLVQEEISPASLKNEVEWTSPDNAAPPPRIIGDAYYY